MIKMVQEMNDIYVPRLDKIEVAQHVEVAVSPVIAVSNSRS